MRNKKYLTTLAVVTAMSLIGCGTKTDTNTVSTDSSVIATSSDAVSETTVESTNASTTNNESSSETSTDKPTDESTEPSSETGTESSTEESTAETSTEEGSTKEPDEETSEEPEGQQDPETEPSTETPTQPEVTEEATIPTTTVTPTTVVPTTTVEPTVPTTTVAPTTVAPTTVAPTTVAPTTAPSTPEPTKPVITVKKVEASVKGTHYVGDTLTSADFTVKVTMSDGSVKTNPSGFTVSPLKLSAKTNTLTVSYGSVSSTFTVNATEKPAPTTPPVQTNGSYSGSKVLISALEQLGSPYKAGGKSSSGFDCSGLVWYAYHQNGIEIPASASGQAKCGTKYPIYFVNSGDIIVYEYTDGTYHTGLCYDPVHMIDALQWSSASLSGVKMRPILDMSLSYPTLKRMYCVKVGNNTDKNTANPEWIKMMQEKWGYVAIGWTDELEQWAEKNEAKLKSNIGYENNCYAIGDVQTWERDEIFFDSLSQVNPAYYFIYYSAEKHLNE